MALPNARAGNYIAGQLLCCGLTPLLVYGEAQAAESGDDSCIKMKLLVKELEETRAWLKLIFRKETTEQTIGPELLNRKNEELITKY